LRLRFRIFGHDGVPDDDDACEQRRADHQD
jgi:hypothetical protein